MLKEIMRVTTLTGLYCGLCSTSVFAQSNNCSRIQTTTEAACQKVFDNILSSGKSDSADVAAKTAKECDKKAKSEGVCCNMEYTVAELNVGHTPPEWYVARIGEKCIGSRSYEAKRYCYSECADKIQNAGGSNFRGSCAGLCRYKYGD